MIRRSSVIAIIARSLHDLGLIKGARLNERSQEGSFETKQVASKCQVDLGTREGILHCHVTLRALSPQSDNLTCVVMPGGLALC